MKFTQEIFDNCKWIDDYVIRYKYVKYRIVKCRNCGVLCLIKRYKNVDGYCSYQCRNKKMSNEHKENLSKLLTGRKLSKKHVEKLIGRKFVPHYDYYKIAKGKKAFEIMTKKTNKDYAEYWLWNETSFPFDIGSKYLELAKKFKVKK